MRGQHGLQFLNVLAMCDYHFVILRLVSRYHDCQTQSLRNSDTDSATLRSGFGPSSLIRSVIISTISANVWPCAEDRLNISSRSASMPASASTCSTSADALLRAQVAFLEVAAALQAAGDDHAVHALSNACMM